MASDGLALRSGLLLSHPIPLGIGYRFHGFVNASCHRVLGIECLVPWFLSYFMPLGTRELAYRWGRGFRGNGGSWDIRMVLDCLRSLGIRFCQLRVSLEFAEFRECFVVISPGLSLARERVAN